MSTCIHLECRSHQPPIQSGEVGQHDGQIEQIRSDLRHRDDLRDILEDGWTHHDAARMRVARFITQHPDCDIAIVDEYGEQHGVVTVNDLRERAR